MASSSSSSSSSSSPRPTVVLVLGASGMLGRAVHKRLVASLPPGSVVGTCNSRQGPDLVPCNVLDEAGLRAFLATHQPTVVINCVAERRPDAVEKEQEKGWRLNVRLVEVLAEASAQLPFYLLHISTDYVFPGDAPPYKPEDAPRPLNTYGEGKLASEEVLRKHPEAHNWLILRVPVLYGDSTSLEESSVTVLAKDVLNAGTQKKVDDWAVRFATHTADVARVMEALVQKALAGEAVHGTIHYSSKERQPNGAPFTKFNICMLVGEILGQDTSHLLPDSEPPKGALRPKDCKSRSCVSGWEVGREWEIDVTVWSCSSPRTTPTIDR